MHQMINQIPTIHISLGEYSLTDQRISTGERHNLDAIFSHIYYHY